MEQFTNKLASFGMWAGKNKYLGSIKDAFQEYMPFTIIGAVGTLWTSVICNADTGLGAFIPAIMALDFLNPAFKALNFATIGCITLGITFTLGIKVASRNDLKGCFPGLIALAALMTVTNVSQTVTSIAVTLADGTSTTIANLLPEGSVAGTFSGIGTGIFGATGLFTGMIMAVLSVELLTYFNKFDKLKIKLPDTVPPNIAASFNVLIPGCITLLITSLLGLACVEFTGNYMNDLIFNLIQTPLQNVGGSYIGGLTFVIIISVFWCVGIHGNNMVSAITSPLLLALLLENEAAVQAGNAAVNIVNNSSWYCFVAFTGTGITGAITIAIFLVGKRDDNRAIASLAAVPNMFNISEIVVFGLPIVLNPIMSIGFILAPIVSYSLFYLLTYIGFCPIMYINIPWTTPPVLAGILASGGNIMGGITQLICLIGAVAVYIPCIKLYEKQQNASDLAHQK